MQKQREKDVNGNGNGNGKRNEEKVGEENGLFMGSHWASGSDCVTYLSTSPELLIYK